MKGSDVSTAARRHTMGHIDVARQSPTSAKARSYMLISNVPAAVALNPLTTELHKDERRAR